METSGFRAMGVCSGGVATKLRGDPARYLTRSPSMGCINTDQQPPLTGELNVLVGLAAPDTKNA